METEISNEYLKQLIEQNKEILEQNKALKEKVESLDNAPKDKQGLDLLARRLQGKTDLSHLISCKVETINTIGEDGIPREMEIVNAVYSVNNGGSQEQRTLKQLLDLSFVAKYRSLARYIGDYYLNRYKSLQGGQRFKISGLTDKQMEMLVYRGIINTNRLKSLNSNGFKLLIAPFVDAKEYTNIYKELKNYLSK